VAKEEREFESTSLALLPTSTISFCFLSLDCFPRHYTLIEWPRSSHPPKMEAYLLSSSVFFISSFLHSSYSTDPSFDLL